RRYAEGLAGLGLLMQKGITEAAHARHLFAVQLPLQSMRRTRDELLLALRACQIGATVHYAPLHTMPLYSRGTPARLPVTEEVARGMMALAIRGSMAPGDADYVIEHLRQVLD